MNCNCKHQMVCCYAVKLTDILTDILEDIIERVSSEEWNEIEALIQKICKYRDVND